MDPAAAAARLRALYAEALFLPSRTTSSEFTSWHGRTVSIPRRSLGLAHHITLGFDGLEWTATTYTGLGQHVADANAFDRARSRARGFLDAAAHELEDLAADRAFDIDAGSFDQELWTHIRDQVEAQDWGRSQR